jgi:uncharacterized protein with PIN domain
MAKRKPKPMAPAPPAIAEAVVERVVAKLVTIRSRAEVFTACLEDLDLALEPDQARAAIDEAQRRIRLAAACDLDAELGASKTRLVELFEKAMTAGELRIALQVQREINRLLALYGRDSADSTAGDGGSDALADLAAARAHLAPLVAAGDDEPLEEIARRVVGLFTHTGPSLRAK